jgi:hypothetical protein
VPKSLIILELTAVVTMMSIGAAKYDFRAGKLINIAADERLDEGTSYRWAIFTVQVADLVETARGERIRRRSGDPPRRSGDVTVFSTDVEWTYDVN